MMQDDSLFHPWECKGLDPFCDDPVASDSEFGYDIEEAKSDDLEVSDMEAPCTCGNCVHMPSLEDCAASSFWAGKENIILDSRIWRCKRPR